MLALAFVQRCQKGRGLESTRPQDNRGHIGGFILKHTRPNFFIWLSLTTVVQRLKEDTCPPSPPTGKDKIQRYLKVGVNQSRALNSLLDPIRHFFFLLFKRPEMYLMVFWTGGRTESIHLHRCWSRTKLWNQILDQIDGTDVLLPATSTSGWSRLSVNVHMIRDTVASPGWPLDPREAELKREDELISGLKSTASRFHF